MAVWWIRKDYTFGALMSLLLLVLGWGCLYLALTSNTKYYAHAGSPGGGVEGIRDAKFALELTGVVLTAFGVYIGPMIIATWLRDVKRMRRGEIKKTLGEIGLDEFVYRGGGVLHIASSTLGREVFVKERRYSHHQGNFKLTIVCALFGGQGQFPREHKTLSDQLTLQRPYLIGGPADEVTIHPTESKGMIYQFVGTVDQWNSLGVTPSLVLPWGKLQLAECLLVVSLSKAPLRKDSARRDRLDHAMIAYIQTPD
jgi:hypothetical protein